MAEVLGLVASGISIAALAAQIANSIAKLKSYWDAVKEAPEDIKVLVEEIEVFQLVFLDIEEDRGRNPISSMILDATSLSRCLELCRRGADRLKELTDDLGNDLDAPSKLKRRWAASKVVFKKDKIDKYKARLERAISLLSLANQCYTRALIQLQPDIIVSRLSSSLCAIQNPSTVVMNSDAIDANTLPSRAPETSKNDAQSSNQQACSTQLVVEQTPKASKRCNSRQEERLIHYRRAVWFVNWLWDVEFLRSRSGWSLKLRTYNIVSKDSLAFAMVQTKDVEGLRRLFDSGKASVYDVQNIGMGDWTMLRAAAFGCNLSMSRFLLECGAEPDVAPDGGFTPVEELVVNAVCTEHESGDLAQVARLFVNNYDAELPVSLLRNFRGPTEAFRCLQNLTDVPYYESSLEERIEIAIGLARDTPMNRPETLWFAIEPGTIPSAASHYLSPIKGTLLHAVAFAMGKAMDFRYYYSISPLEDLECWRQIFRELVSSGADLHSVSNRANSLIVPDGITPFGELFSGLISGVRHYDDWRVLLSELSRQLLKLWLEDLEVSGIDLLEYGKKEREMHGQLQIRGHPGYFLDGHLIDFTYGASPDDWRLLLSEPTDSYAQQFWEMVEPPELTIPGEWID